MVLLGPFFDFGKFPKMGRSVVGKVERPSIVPRNNWNFNERSNYDFIRSFHLSVERPIVIVLIIIIFLPPLFEMPVRKHLATYRKDVWYIMSVNH